MHLDPPRPARPSRPRRRDRTSDDASPAELEQQLAASRREVLGIEHIGVHDNFFDLGGNSLLAIQLVLYRTRFPGHNIAVKRPPP